MSNMSKFAVAWASYKPRLYALALGLVAGPIISNIAGWQMMTSSAQSMARAGVVEQQALFCDSRARAENKDPGKLDWSARNDLAKKWAGMPGSATVDSDVVSACARKLNTT